MKTTKEKAVRLKGHKGAEESWMFGTCVMEVVYHHTLKSGRKTEEDGKMTTGSGSTEVISDFVQSTSEKCE